MALEPEATSKLCGVGLVYIPLPVAVFYWRGGWPADASEIVLFF